MFYAELLGIKVADLVTSHFGDGETKINLKKTSHAATLLLLATLGKRTSPALGSRVEFKKEKQRR